MPHDKHGRKKKDRKSGDGKRDRKRQRRKARHADKPKRPLTGYMLFCAEQRHKLKQEQPQLSFSEVGKQLGILWKNISPLEKLRLDDIAVQEKLRYREAMNNYKKNHPESSSDEAESSKPSKKRRRKRKDQNAPKRPLSAFFHFSASKRPELRNVNSGLKFGELGKILGERWRALDADARAPYQQMAEEDRIRYEREMAEYRLTRPKSPVPSSSSSSSSSSFYSSSSSDSSSSSSSSSYSSSSESVSSSSSYSS